MRSGVLQRRGQRHRENVARLFRRDDGIDKSAGSCITSIQLVLVVLAHFVYCPGDLRVEWLPAPLGVLDRRPMDGLNRRLTFHHTHSPRRPTEDEIGIET